MVIIADRNSHRCLLGAVVADRGSGLKADVFEFAVAQIPVEIFRCGVVGDVDVGAAGIVEVGPDHAQPVVAVWDR